MSLARVWTWVLGLVASRDILGPLSIEGGGGSLQGVESQNNNNKLFVSIQVKSLAHFQNSDMSPPRMAANWCTYKRIRLRGVLPPHGCLTGFSGWLPFHFISLYCMYTALVSCPTSMVHCLVLHLRSLLLLTNPPGRTMLPRTIRSWPWLASNLCSSSSSTLRLLASIGWQ